MNTINQNIIEIMKNSTTKEIIECVDRLENYNSLFDIHTLFSILHDLMDKCNTELDNNFCTDAKGTINKIESLSWVIREKLPLSLFEDIEKITFLLKYQDSSSYGRKNTSAK